MPDSGVACSRRCNHRGLTLDKGKPRCDLAGYLLRAPSDVGLPDSQHRPAGLSQRALATDIAGSVGGNLGDPVGRVCPPRKLPTKLWPVAPTPEVAVAKDREMCR